MRLSEHMVTQVCEMYYDGHSPYDIAMILGVTLGKVRKALKLL